MIIWLASYPKSGNTWLRALLSSYYFTKDGEFTLNLLEKINAFPSEKQFKNYPDKFLKPDDTSKYWIEEQEKINKKNKIIFLKTHMALCKVSGNRFTNERNSLGAIYIVRDPRNLITSLSHHYQISPNEAFNFMKDEKRAIYSKIDDRYVGFQFLMSWSLNQKSWIENKIFPVLVIKYEELINETFVTFKRVIDFINRITNSSVKLDKKKAMNSIKNTSFDKLQILEKEKGFTESMFKKGTKEKIKFFNLGQSNNYKKLLPENITNDMNEYFKKELIKFNYEQ
tara:strand:- start:154 stop:1002 length:849 start_codon:yes stop_codon:yes gene_type:complete